MGELFRETYLENNIISAILFETEVTVLPLNLKDQNKTFKPFIFLFTLFIFLCLKKQNPSLSISSIIVHVVCVLFFHKFATKTEKCWQ